MIPGAVHILATGARTPLGLRSAPSAAAVRAGISVLGHHPSLVDHSGEPMVAALDSQLDPALAGCDRFVALAEGGLEEVSEVLAKTSAPPLTLHLALPEARPGFTEQDAAEIGRRLGKLSNLSFQLGRVRTYAQGHAAGALALQAAIDALASGSELCIVGGVECYFAAPTMHWLDSHRQLAGSDGRSSFVPGEGAGFLLLSNRRPTERGLQSRGVILSCGLATERARIKTPELCLGEGLCAAVRQAVSGLPASQRIMDIVCDINGERYRGQEWGFVCLRLAKYFDDPLAYRAPANVWGDQGAASIPLFATLAIQAAARGYARGPVALLTAGSEGGQRAAVLVQGRGG